QGRLGVFASYTWTWESMIVIGALLCAARVWLSQRIRVQRAGASCVADARGYKQQLTPAEWSKHRGDYAHRRFDLDSYSTTSGSAQLKSSMDLIWRNFSRRKTYELAWALLRSRWNGPPGCAYCGTPYRVGGLSQNRQKQHNHVDRLSLHERRRDLLIAS